MDLFLSELIMLTGLAILVLLAYYFAEDNDGDDDDDDQFQTAGGPSVFFCTL